jgi:hypothetical protein
MRVLRPVPEYVIRHVVEYEERWLVAGRWTRGKPNSATKAKTSRNTVCEDCIDNSQMFAGRRILIVGPVRWRRGIIWFLVSKSSFDFNFHFECWAPGNSPISWPWGDTSSVNKRIAIRCVKGLGHRCLQLFRLSLAPGGGFEGIVEICCVLSSSWG